MEPGEPSESWSRIRQMFDFRATENPTQSHRILSQVPTDLFCASVCSVPCMYLRAMNHTSAGPKSLAPNANNSVCIWSTLKRVTSLSSPCVSPSAYLFPSSETALLYPFWLAFALVITADLPSKWEAPKNLGKISRTASTLPTYLTTYHSICKARRQLAFFEYNLRTDPNIASPIRSSSS